MEELNSQKTCFGKIGPGEVTTLKDDILGFEAPEVAAKQGHGL